MKWWVLFYHNVVPTELCKDEMWVLFYHNVVPTELCMYTNLQDFGYQTNFSCKYFSYKIIILY